MRQHAIDSSGHRVLNVAVLPRGWALCPACLAQAGHVGEFCRCGATFGAVPIADLPAAVRPGERSKSYLFDRLNKTERRFYADILLPRAAEFPVVLDPHGFVLCFPNGDRYTPDFVGIGPGSFTAFECKGGYRGPGWEQGFERFKRARERWGLGIRFELWEWRKDRWEKLA